MSQLKQLGAEVEELRKKVSALKKDWIDCEERLPRTFLTPPRAKSCMPLSVYLQTRSFTPLS